VAEPIRTEAELRRAFPTASPWWIKLQLALLRDDGGSLAIAVRNSKLEAAIFCKIWPELYPDVRSGQGIKSAATTALTKAIRPRRTGKPRGRPPLHLDHVVADIHACFEGNHFHDEQRLRAVVLAHLGPMSISQRVAVLLDLEQILERQGRRADWPRRLRLWRRMLRTRPETLKESDTE
jgi:hypothetical protein